jgi:hypothetical protein
MLGELIPQKDVERFALLHPHDWKTAFIVEPSPNVRARRQCNVAWLCGERDRLLAERGFRQARVGIAREESASGKRYAGCCAVEQKFAPRVQCRLIAPAL